MYNHPPRNLPWCSLRWHISSFGQIFVSSLADGKVYQVDVTTDSGKVYQVDVTTSGKVYQVDVTTSGKVYQVDVTTSGN